MSLVDSSDASVDVVVRIESNATANMTLNSSDISYTGLADGQKLTFGVDKTAVVVSGNESDIDRIKGFYTQRNNRCIWIIGRTAHSCR